MFMASVVHSTGVLLYIPSAVLITSILGYWGFYLTHRWDPWQVLPLRVRVDLGAMAIKGWLHTPKDSELYKLSTEVLPPVAV